MILENVHADGTFMQPDCGAHLFHCSHFVPWKSMQPNAKQYNNNRTIIFFYFFFDANSEHMPGLTAMIILLTNKNEKKNQKLRNKQKLNKNEDNKTVKLAEGKLKGSHNIQK